MPNSFFGNCFDHGNSLDSNSGGKFHLDLGSTLSLSNTKSLLKLTVDSTQTADETKSAIAI